MAGKKKLKYQVALEEFLAAREWTDELEIDMEEKKVQLATGISIGDQSGNRLFVEGYDETDFVDVFIYYGIKCKEAKLGEMSSLLNEIHRRWLFGRFVCLDDGTLRWSQRVDFEGSSPTGTSIERMVSSGWESAERFLDVIAAVALTKQSAKDAIAEYDEARRAKAAEAEGDGPAAL